MSKAKLGMLVTSCLTLLCFSDVIPVPPTEETIQGSWIGLPYEMNEYCRLVLTNKHGFFARGFDQQKPLIYAVDSYRVDRQGSVKFKTSPASTNAYPIAVSGTARPYEIRIVIRSPDGGWSRTSVLCREETAERVLRDMRNSMEQISGK